MPAEVRNPAVEEPWTQNDMTSVSRCRAYKVGNQLIASGSWAGMSWEGVKYDNLGEFNLALNRFIPEEDGYYCFLFQARLSYLVGAGNTFYIRLNKAGTEFARHGDVLTADPGSRSSYINLQCIEHLTATSDYVQAQAWHNSGSAQNLVGNATIMWTRLDIHRLS